MRRACQKQRSSAFTGTPMIAGQETGKSGTRGVGIRVNLYNLAAAIARWRDGYSCITKHVQSPKLQLAGGEWKTRWRLCSMRLRWREGTGEEAQKTLGAPVSPKPRNEPT